MLVVPIMVHLLRAAPGQGIMVPLSRSPREEGTVSPGQQSKGREIAEG